MNTHRSSNAHRGAPEAAAPNTDTGASVSANPSWVRLPALENLRGIKKGTCYNLIATGAITSVRLPSTPQPTTAKTTPKKSTKGVRLIFLPSVDAFLNRLADEQINNLKVRC